MALIPLVLFGIATLWAAKTQKPNWLIALLAACACLLALLVVFSSNKKVDVEELEDTRATALGFTLAGAAIPDMAAGDEILLLTTTFPVWQDMSQEMQEGVKKALKDRQDILVRTLDITTLEGGNSAEPDGAKVLRNCEDQIKGADAIIGAFPMMGEFNIPVPKLPPVFAYVDTPSSNWMFLVGKKRLDTVAMRSMWQYPPSTTELHPLEGFFRKEYVLVTPENLDKFLPR